MGKIFRMNTATVILHNNLDNRGKRTPCNANGSAFFCVVKSIFHDVANCFYQQMCIRDSTYESRHRLGGTGYLQEQPVGTQYTLAQLLEYTIRYSDNNAFLMVREAVPTDGFKQFVRTLGLLHENSMDSLGAVSYTHLDVYKRQSVDTSVFAV